MDLICRKDTLAFSTFPPGPLCPDNHCNHTHLKVLRMGPRRMDPWATPFSQLPLLPVVPRSFLDRSICPLEALRAPHEASRPGSAGCRASSRGLASPLMP